MKTTIDLPDNLLRRAKIAAAERKTTLKDLMVVGLDWAIRTRGNAPEKDPAIERMRRGLHLGGGQPLKRDETHERR